MIGDRLGVDLSEDQLEAVDLLNNGNILVGGVGTGKTRTALTYFMRDVCKAEFPINGRGKFGSVERPLDLYVITTAKKKAEGDWLDETHDFLIGTDHKVSFGGIKVTIDSWNNITKYADVKDAFFMFDEQRAVGKGVWAKTFIKIAQNNKWVMLSATPGDVWMDYVPVFIANGFYKNRTDFCDRHVVWNPYTKFPSVKRYVGTAVLQKRLDSLVVDIRHERHTTRHEVKIPVGYDLDLWNKVVDDRWHVYEERPIKEAGELAFLMRRVVNTSSERLAKLEEVYQLRKRVIVFYNFTSELKMIREFLDSKNILYSEWNGLQHRPVPTGDEWVYLVQYTAGAEGWNCITTDTVLFYSLNYSYKIKEQAMGRIDRRNTPYKDLYYYSLVSDSLIDKAITDSLGKKRKFNEKIFLGAFEKVMDAKNE